MPNRELVYTETAHCEVPAQLENVAIIAKKLKDFCQIRGLDETLWMSIELGFCEGLNNAIEHGCENDESKTVSVSWSWNKESLTIDITDPSKFVPQEGAQELPEDILSDSGRGGYIIDSIFDIVTHSEESTGHKLHLEKEIHPKKDMLAEMQSMYESLQELTGSISLSYSKVETTHQLSEVLSTEKQLHNYFERCFESLSKLVDIQNLQYWAYEQDLLSRKFSKQDPGATDLSAHIYLSEDCLETQVFKNNTHSIDKSSIESESNYRITLPISFQNRNIGVLAITCENTTPQILKESFINIFLVLASQVVIAQQLFTSYKEEDYSNREDAQMEIASEIQKSLLPSDFPNNQYCKMTGKCVTAMAVGGDYIDTIEIDGQGILIVIADVMGKGVPAALLATIFRTAIRSRINLAETPGWLLSKINKQIHQELGHLNMFITAQAAFYTYDKKILKLASAGHCPALALKGDDCVVTQLDADGIPLGIDANDIYEEKLFDMKTGDRVLFLTDGLYEAENNDGKMLGIDGLSNELPQLWDGGLETLPTRTFDLVSNFASDSSMQDDQTIMALEIL